MQRASPYQSFRGQTEEAFAFYRSVFGGDYASVVRYRDIGMPGADEARRVFAALADGGTTAMPLERTAWAELFGACSDRYGVHWMVDYTGEVQYPTA